LIRDADERGERVMAEQENVQVVREAYAAFMRADIPALLGLLTEDVAWETPGRPEVIPYAGRRSGRGEVGEFFEILDGAEEFTRFEPGEFIAQGDRVVVLGNYAGRVRASGGPYDLEWVHVFTVRDGRIAAFREYIDTAALTDAYQTAAAATGV
jgi:ketosteroid isomerase-like protein